MITCQSRCVVWASAFLSYGILSSGAMGELRRPKVVAYFGTGQVKIQFRGNDREATIGTELDYGSIITTGKSSGITISYPDGSLVAVGNNTQFAILEKIGGVQGNQLETGTVRGSVEKPAEPIKKPKFVIRTKAAVMGVRGTEFVMGVDSFGLKTQVHTLEGVVDVAANEMSLFSGQATPVPSGNFVEATGQGLSPPQSFDKADFLDSLKADSNSALSANTSSSSGSSSASSLGRTGDASSSSGKRDPSDPNGKENQPEPEKPKDPKKEEEQKKKEEEEERKIRLLSFQVAAFYATGIIPEKIRAVSASWNPTIPIPVLKFLSVRGNFGVMFGKNGSLGNHFIAREFQVFVTGSLLNTFFLEMGMGEQVWPQGGPTAGVSSLNAGLLTKAVGLIDRIFVGRTTMNLRGAPNAEYKAGVGLNF